MEKIKGSEALMLALKNEGVTTIFGYPGGSIMPVYDALYDYTRGEKKPLIIFLSDTNKELRMLQKAMQGLAERLEYAWSQVDQVQQTR